MHIYFEKLSIFRLFFFLVRRKYKNTPIRFIYYFDSSLSGHFLSLTVQKFTTIKIIRLNFKMKDVRDQNDELIRLRICREDIKIFSEFLHLDPFLKKVINDPESSDRYKNYIFKGIIEGEISIRNSIYRSLYLIQVVSWHMKSRKTNQSYFFAEKRPWHNHLEKLSLEQNINLVAHRSIIFQFTFFLISRLRLKNFPKLYLILKDLKYRRFSKDFISKDNTLYLEGRAGLNFQKNASNSDFFWEIQSKFKRSRIIYRYSSQKEKIALENNGVGAISGSCSIKDIIKVRKINTLPKQDWFSTESLQLNSLSNEFNNQFNYWKSLFLKHNTKVFFSWYKFNKDHIAVSEAIRDVGGISILWQIALNSIQDKLCMTDADILFSYSSHCAAIDTKIGSKFKYNLLSGYPGDYAFNLTNDFSSKLKATLIKNGAKLIVCVLDENSLDDDRWHTGHELQRENYSFMLEEVLRNPSLGVIFKPKKSINLRRRLGNSISNLIDKAKKTGRCFVFEETIGHTVLATPVIAAQAADLCIHGHLCAGTAAVETALSGVPTILVDRESSSVSILKKLPEGKIIFRKWPEVIQALKYNNIEEFKKINLYGWEEILNKLDPFRDGLGAQRIGNFTESIFEEFNKGNHRDKAMELATEKYADTWGEDKVIINK